jgi:hypothetical protein
MARYEDFLVGDIHIERKLDLLKTAWDDLRFPAQGINPAGSAAPPTVDDTTFPGTLLFSGSADNLVGGVAQMPHAWKPGTVVRPHVHWAKTTSASGVVVWQFRYSIADIGDTLSTYSDWITGTVVVSDSNTANKHALTTFGDVVMTGVGESGIIVWEFRRFASDSSDTYNAVNARFLELDFHYQINKLGTPNEIPD